MDSHSLSMHHKPGIAIDACCSPEFLSKLHDLAKCIPQLKQTGDNFGVWERNLKIMIGTLTGSSDYFLRESHKHHPKFNRAVLNLIFWSIDEELQQVLNIDGSAGDAFQVLAGRFQSNSPTRCIMGGPDFPEEILDNIVNMVYQQSLEERDFIKKRKLERISQALQKGSKREAYVNQCGPPILNPFQNLAVVNRKFHRLCLPKLWQRIRFPSAIPGPMSIWTEDILLNYGNLVKSFEFDLDDLSSLPEYTELPEIKRSLNDNIPRTVYLEDFECQGIGLVNIEKIFKACPCLKSVTVNIPEASYTPSTFSDVAYRLSELFGLVPQLQVLGIDVLEGEGLPGGFVIDALKNLPSLVSLNLAYLKFQGPSIEGSLGWALAQHQKLRRLSLDWVTCQDPTWTLKSWPQPLTTLEIQSSEGLTPLMVYKLLSASSPFLTRLSMNVGGSQEEPHVDDWPDLPALKELSIYPRDFSLLTSFKGCKNINLIQYNHILTYDQCDTLKHFLSTRTWPKLAVLNIGQCDWLSGSTDKKVVTKEDVNEIWNSFGIKLLVH